MFSKVHGRFLKYTGAIHLDDDATKSWVEATIDAASIDTGTPQRDAHLRSAELFDVATFPELQFRSRVWRTSARIDCRSSVTSRFTASRVRSRSTSSIRGEVRIRSVSAVRAAAAEEAA